MSGSANAPVERRSDDLSPAAFLVTPEAVHSDIRTPNRLAWEVPGQDALADWPLSSHLELGPLLSGASNARIHTRLVMQEWGLDALVETVELLVSELTTNALRASRSLTNPLPSPIHLWLRADRLRIIVTVWDAAPWPPVRKEIREDDEGGRGLMLVETLSTRWGWYEPRNFAGKYVWCELEYSQVRK
jgi:anti-sigma regulatory factor (Ser/Thr protein kinase)